jgi:hypothetical protein
MAASDGTSPDAIVDAYDDQVVDLVVRPLDDDYLLLEGDQESLLFLSDLIRAVATGRDCGFQIAPQGPGSAWFSPDSATGLYIHRTPCAEPDSGHSRLT